jgi:hypothetical protein
MKKLYSLFILVFLFSVFSAQAQWSALNGPPGGNISDLEYDPIGLKVYAVINNGLYVSSNDGTSWTKIVPTTPTNLYVYDFMIDGTVLYAVYYYQLYSSVDGGANWTKVNTNNSATFNGAYNIIKVASGIYAVYGYNGVYVSTDSGATWTQISTQYVYQAVATATGDLYFVDTDGIKKHLNPGTNAWASGSVVKILTDVSSYSNRLAVLGTSIFANVSSSNTTTNVNDLLKYNGTSWVSVKTGISEGSFSGTWTNSSAGLYFYNSAYTVPKVYFTTTASAGAAWTTTNPWPSATYGGSSVNVVRFASATKAFAATSGDGVFLTTNTGTSWALASGGLYGADGRDVVLGTGSPARVFVRTGYSSKGYWYSDDKGVTWNFQNTPLSQIYKLTKMSNGTLLGLGQGSYPVQYSTTNGATWVNSGTGSDYLNYLAYNTTFSATYNYAIAGNRLASTTNGSTWTTITVTGLPASYYPYGLAQDNSGNLFAMVYNYATSKYECYVVVLAGGVASATTATATLTSAIPYVSNDQNYFYANGVFVNNNKLYVSSSYAIYSTADQGTTWNATAFSNNGLYPLPNGTGICASTSGALYVSSDDGKTWSDIAMPNSDGYIQGLVYDAATTTYYACGYNTPALKDVVPSGSLLPASPPVYINFNWTATNGPWGGSISKLMLDNSNNVYAYTNGYLYQDAISFASAWTDVTQGNYLYSVDIDKPTNKLYGVTYGQLFTSISGGAWTKVTSGSESYPGAYYFKKCSNGDLVMASWDNKIYLSTNGGTSFGASKYTINGSPYDLEVTSTATPGIFLHYYDNTANDTRLVRSVDRGVTWTSVTTVNPRIQFIATSGTTLFVSSINTSSGVEDVSKSTDNGATWTSIKGDLAGSNHTHLWVSPAGDLYISGYNNSSQAWGLYKSTNGGTNWTFISLSSISNNSASDIAWLGTRMVISTGQGVFSSDDGGATLTDRNAGIPRSNLYDLELSSQSKLYARDNSNARFVSTDFQNWNNYTSYSFNGFTRKPDGTLLAFDNNKLYQTADGGNTWSVISSSLPNSFTNIVTADGTTYYGNNYNQIQFSSNLTTWTPLNPTGLPQTFNIYDVAADQNGLIYIVIYNNSNSTYEAYEILFGSAIKINQAKNPQNVEFAQNKILLFDGNGAILTTTDGNNWTKSGAPGGSKLIIASQNYYFISSSGGNLWLSRDQGQSWQNVGLNTGGNSNFNFNDVVVNEYNGYAYGAISNSPIRKSSNIVIPSDLIAPAVVTLSPANNATNVANKPALSITFDQAAVPVAGKYLRILDVASPVTPVEIIDVALSVQNGKTFTFTPVNALGYNKSYFIIVDNGSFTDIFNNAWTGITSQTIWKFQVGNYPDKKAPVITYAYPDNLTKGAGSKTFSMTITDSVSVATAKIFFRSITKTTGMDSANLTLNGSKWEASVPEATFGPMGLEYYFIAIDPSNNKAVSLASGSAHYYSYIVYPNSGSSMPQIPTGLIGTGGGAGDWRMISVPYQLTDSKISTVFNELGTSDNTKWRMITYKNGTTPTWNQYPTNFSTFTQGLGYFINVKDSPGSGLAIDGATTPANNQATPFVFTLSPGWNQIGNPYNFPMKWSEVRAANSNPSSIALKLKKFTGTYVDDTSDALAVFEGAFVLNSGSSPVTLTVPIGGSLAGGRIESNGPDLHDLSGSQWVVPISLKVGNVENTFGGVGMNPDAQVGVDNHDDFNPPHFENYAEMSFPHPEHFLKESTKDVVPTQSDYEWKFTVNSNLQSQGNLTWNNTEFGSNTKELFLYDLQSGVLIDMREQNNYTFDPNKSSAFKIYYGNDLKTKIKPISVTLGDAYPNPAADNVTIPFTVPDQSDNTSVRLEVFDMVGRRVDTLIDKPLPSGFYSAQWQVGSSHTSGMYVYRLVAGGQTLSGKIVIMK